jgi:curved DNA-binding protein CbpA
MDENFLSPYDILGVSENASLGEIHCAYKRLVRTVHPDRNQKVYNWTKEDVNEAFQMIFQAYKTLVKQKKVSTEDFPETNVDYILEEEYRISKEEASFDIKQFNQNFDLMKQKFNTLDDDPNNKGYSFFNHGAEDVKMIKFDNSLIIYKEPHEYLQPTTAQNLGESVINDYSINSNNLEGSDLKIAYREPTKLGDIEEEDVEVKLKELLNEREKIIPEIDTKVLEEKKKKKERIEQIRLNKLRKRDEILVTSLYLK